MKWIEIRKAPYFYSDYYYYNLDEASIHACYTTDNTFILFWKNLMQVINYLHNI